MKKIFSIKRNYSYHVLYHFFAVVGVISSFFFIVSWSDAKVSNEVNLKENMAMPAEVNISAESARAFISSFGKRFVKPGNEVPPKGYFISRASISWLLENTNLNGIYVYPAVNAQGVVCAVAEGGISGNASFNIVEGIAGRTVMSDSPCPNDCGTLGR